MWALSHHLAKRLTRLSGLVPLGTFAAMRGSWVLLLPTMPLISAARVIKCLATVPDGWPDAYADIGIRHEESMWSPQAERPALGRNIQWGLHIDLACTQLRRLWILFGAERLLR